MAPLVSIIIPVYNAGEYLRLAVGSVVCQTYTHVEILIVDDGSSDGCLRHIEHLQDPRVRLFQKDHAGRAAALNFALKRCAGEFYVIQDADDLSDPRRLERQVQGLLAEPKLAALFTGYDIILKEKRFAPRFRAKSVEECRAAIQACQMPSHDPTAMFRVALTKGFEYETSLRVGAAWDHILRIGEQFPMMVLGECLYSYRIHEQSNSRADPQRRQEGIRRVLERARQRRGVATVPGLSLNGAEQSKRSSPEHGLITSFMESVLDQRAVGHPLEAIKTALSCVHLQPLAPDYYKPLLYSIAPLGLINRYRAIKNRAMTRPNGSLPYAKEN